MRIRVSVILSIAAIVGAGSTALLCHRVARAASSKPISDSRRPELEYLIAVNSAAPPNDPQLLFLLMGQYASANQQAAGAEFFAARLEEFGPRLDDGQKALYLTAGALLRAQNAAAVPLLRRIAYVNDTIAMLDQWKSIGQAPDQVIAQHRTAGQADRKILVCAYPNAAIYKGSGSVDDPANFRCGP